MAALLITYDLKTPGQDYKEFRAVIKSYPAWARLSESSYAIATLESADDVAAKLQPFVDKNDQFYVIPLGQRWNGYGPVEVNQWLNGHL